LRVVEFGESPELWRAHRIQGTPSLVITDSRSKMRRLLEGLADARLLEGALGEVQNSNPPGVPREAEPPPPGKSRREEAP
jgi:hypothetical protein